MPIQAKAGAPETSAAPRQMMRKAAGHLVALTGWRRALVIFLLGAVASSALPPLHLIPVLVISFSALAWLTDAIHERGKRGVLRAFAVGWWFGLGHFVAGLYWIAHALLVDAAQFAWMIPFAVVGLSAVLAVFTGLATATTHASGLKGVPAILVLAVAWTAGEWLRGHLFTGFPWNLIGTVWAGSDAMMQAAAVVGVYGLGMVTVVLAALPSTLASPARARRQQWAATIAAAMALAVIWAGGATRLVLADSGLVANVRLRLVQPDIPQSLKWNPALRERHVLDTMELTRGSGFDRITDVIWPEAASPFALSESAAMRQAIAAAVPPGGLLITGAPRVSRDPTGIKVWNSLYALDGSGAIAAVFDKFHLVPFGEYVPFRSILPIEKITPGIGDFSAGPGPQTVALPGLPKASPLICYEVIFPAHVVDPAERPGWLLNITNDAWFGISSGPYQHFAAARFRAVEEGLPLVRAANNGISAVVDPYGRVLARLELGRKGVLDADLPRALSPTPYSRFGDAIVAVLALVLLILAFGLRALSKG